MRCIWQMDGDKVKGFKCDFSPVDMLIVVSGLKYITADIERHPKDRERAQGIYNQIMLCRYYDEADRKTENSSENPNNCEDEPTWEQVKEYCNRRCLDIVDSALRKKWYKDEPQTCSFIDCGNFKNPDYERCIECKRKQIKLKTEQTEWCSE